MIHMSSDLPGEGSNVEQTSDMAFALNLLKSEEGNYLPAVMPGAMSQFREVWRSSPATRTMIRASSNMPSKIRAKNKLAQALYQMFESDEWSEDCGLWSGKGKVNPYDKDDRQRFMTHQTRVILENQA